MKTSVRRALVLPTVFVASAALAQAHPGHDGHDLTWDFSHLANYPLATIGCAAVVGASVALALQLFRRRASPGDHNHSLRGSQPSRGK